MVEQGQDHWRWREGSVGGDPELGQSWKEPRETLKNEVK